MNNNECDTPEIRFNKFFDSLSMQKVLGKGRRLVDVKDVIPSMKIPSPERSEAIAKVYLGAIK